MNDKGISQTITFGTLPQFLSTTLPYVKLVTTLTLLSVPPKSESSVTFLQSVTGLSVS